MLALDYPARIKGRKGHWRWTGAGIETVREELVKRSIEKVAKKIDRTPRAIRDMLRRNRLSLRDIRCDLFSVESLRFMFGRRGRLLESRTGFRLRLTIMESGRFYIITPEALKDLYRHHHADLIKAAFAISHSLKRALSTRSSAEFSSIHLPNAISLPVDEIEFARPRRMKDKNQVLLLHCQSGMRSFVAKTKLAGLDYANVFNLGSYARATSRGRYQTSRVCEMSCKDERTLQSGSRRESTWKTQATAELSGVSKGK